MTFGYKKGMTNKGNKLFQELFVALLDNILLIK